jgi:hypothetical protein
MSINERHNSILHHSIVTYSELSTNKNSAISMIRRCSTKEKTGRGSKRNSPGKSKSEKPKKDSKRTDAYGNPIVKGVKGKSFKVTFRDKTSDSPLIDVVQVNSYKKYYNEVDDEDNRVSTNCGCNIF